MSSEGDTSDTVADFLVHKVLNRKLEKRPENCPICSGDIGTTISTVHDRECNQCETKFTLGSEGVPTIHMDTTPVRRVERSIRQKATEEVVLNELGGEQ